MEKFRSTTVLAVRRNGKIAIGADGQVTLGSIQLKAKAKKVRRISDEVVVGMAGSAADALALVERLEGKLKKHGGILLRAAIELAKDWRLDKSLRHLEAEIICVSKNEMLLLSGRGDLLVPDEDCISIGSGSPMALAAARTLLKFTDFEAKKIVEEALTIASDMCIYTNNNFVIEEV